MTFLWWFYDLKASFASTRKLLTTALLLVLGVYQGAQPVPQAQASEGDAAATTRFARTALHLQSAPAPLRAEFSHVALNHLIEILAGEIALAEEELKANTGGRKLRGWSLAVTAYLRELDELQREIVLLEDAQLALVYGGELEIRGADGAVILTHPRSAQQAAMEQAILAEFCLGRNCEAYGNSAPAEAEKPIPLSRGGLRPRWQFTGDGVTCDSQGLSVHFADAAGISRHRLLCAQFLQEALSLADAIAWQQRHGVEVAWASLAVAPLAGRPEQQVTLNGAGDVIILSIPVIAGTDGLLGALLPWLRGRLKPDEDTELGLSALTLGWE